MIPELESVSSLKEKQRTALKGFLYGNMFSLFSQLASEKSLIYQIAPLVVLSHYVIWFFDLIA